MSVAACQLTSASWWTRNDLDKACGNKAAIVYAFGLVDGMEIGSQGGAPRYFCLPPDVVGKQILDVVCQYVERHPEERQSPASYMATAALREAWPCK
ncbi:Rap1a/Tai family immunity protein [Mesorhizobium sp.]|uniref:Rap1a/Tai family immunity protein n=1 Tax=Mesorhizobium sp. TaxID=1871066 RepID=UPI0034508659